MDLPRQRLFSNKRLLLLLIPILLEQELAILVGMVDGIMVSSVGEAAISGVHLVNNISAVLLNLFSALATGGAIVTSQFLGARKQNDAKRSAGQLLTMSTGVAILLMLVCLLFCEPLLVLFFGDIEADVMEAAKIYFFYNSLSFPFLAIYSSCAAILRANGNSKPSFYVSLIRNAVNIAGNALCIYGLGMGTEGVAIPTGVSRMVGAAVMLLVVFNKRNPLKPGSKDIFTVSPPLIGRIFRVGMPTALESSIFQLGRVITLSMITGFGTAQIAANSTANSLLNIVIAGITSFRLASLTVIGQCVGAKDLVQIKENHRKLMLWCYALHTVMGGLFLIFRYELLGLYENLSEETVELAAKLMCIHLIPGLFIYPLSFNLPGSLRAANDSAFPMWVSILSMIIFRLTLAQYLCVHLQWGAVGVWCAMIVDWVCRTICLLIRWHSGAWKKKCNLHTVVPDKV